MCNPQRSCANCLYGDYWREPENCDDPEEFGFDCSYPTLGSKSARSLRTNWSIDDNEELAAECLDYLPETIPSPVLETLVS
jgi:hypothetical protein